MITRLKIALVILCSAIGLLFAPAFTALAASSNPLDQACSQGTASTGAICKQSQAQNPTASNPNPSNPISGPSGVINKAANIVALVAGVGAVIMILIGGFEYVTGGGSSGGGQRAGDPNAVKKAKARITSALIGLVVVTLAWVLVRLITDRVIK